MMACPLVSRRSVLRQRGVMEGIVTIGCFLTTLLFLQMNILRDDHVVFNNYDLEDGSSRSDVRNPSIDYDFELFKNNELCPLISPLLVGWTNVTANIASILLENSDSQLELKLKEAGLDIGGHYSPKNCRARNKIAIIIPYRDRKGHLFMFMSYMHFYLQRQQVEYTIFVIEQAKGLAFNRGLLNNIGYVEAVKTGRPFDCFFFHDVDLLPEDDRNLYICPSDGSARLMSSSIDIYDYRQMPSAAFGGVVAMTTNDFRRVNGYSNRFWGWGNEDDDLYRRVTTNNITVTRHFKEEPFLLHQGRYIMLGHAVEKPNPVKQPLLDSGHLRMKTDGLVDLDSFYSRRKLKLKLLYTFILVDVQQKNV